MTPTKFRAPEKSSIPRDQRCCLCGEQSITTIANLRVGARCLEHVFAIAVDAGVALERATFAPQREVA